MRRYYLLTLSLLLALCLTACKKKSESNVIIVDEPEEVVDTTTVDLGPTEMERKDVEWGGAKCSVTVRRSTDRERTVTDANGRKYYDTQILVRVVNSEGKTFFERKFVKEDFKSCVSGRWMKEGVLLGMPFTEVKGDRLVFRGSVGSPDPLSDEYDPVVMYLNLSASYQVAYDDEPDMYLPGMDDDDGV